MWPESVSVVEFELDPLVPSRVTCVWPRGWRAKVPCPHRRLRGVSDADS